MQYYTDGVTKATDALYICKCKNGHMYWSVTFVSKCSRCGARLTCVPAGKMDNKKGVR